jgi:hypothetical protein
MAKLRRRFYLGVKNGMGLHIISLKSKPDYSLYQYSHQRVIGPFRTFDEACNALALLASTCSL